MIRHISLLLLILALCGCSTIKVIPEPGSTGVIDPKNNSLSITSNDVRVTAKLDEPEFISYQVNDIIATFFVVVENLGSREVSFGPDSFILLDQDNRQATALAPEKVKEIAARDTYYLLPYPYVGFYYLEDYEKSSFENTYGTNLPYYYDLYPQDIFNKALPAGVVIPGAKTAGLVYFRVDLASTKSVKLLVYRKGSDKAIPPEFVFSFKVVK